MSTGGTIKPRLSRRPTRRDFLAGSSVTVVGGLAGCLGGDDGDGGQASPTGQTDGMGTTEGEPEKPDSLTVRAWGGIWQESLDEFVSTPFTEQTGIEIEYDNTLSQEMQSKIRTALNQDREPPVNVQWSLTPLSFRAFTSDLMVPLDTAIVTNLDNLLPPAKPETDTEWPFAKLYTYTYPLNYRTDFLDEPPDSWEVLWNDEFQDSIGIYNDPPGDGFTPVVAQIAGDDLTTAGEMEATWDLYRDVAPNIVGLGDDTNLTQGLQEGEFQVVCMLMNNTLNLKRDGAPVDWVIPKEGAQVKTDAMWIPNGQSESETYWGQKYINIAVAQETQGPWLEQLGVVPLADGAPVPDFMEEDPAFPTSEADFEQLIQVPTANYVQYSPEWAQKVQEILG